MSGGLRLVPADVPDGGLPEHVALISSSWSGGAIRLRFPETLHTSGFDFIDHHPPDVRPRVPSSGLASQWSGAADGSLSFTWEFPDQAFGGSLRAEGESVSLEVWLDNKRPEPVHMAVQFCAVLRGTAFDDPELTRTWLPLQGAWRAMADTDRGAADPRKCLYAWSEGPELGEVGAPWGASRDLLDAAVPAVTTVDGEGVFTVQWDRPRAVMSNAHLPCVHADPEAVLCPPGERTSLHGRAYLLRGGLDRLAHELGLGTRTPG